MLPWLENPAYIWFARNTQHCHTFKFRGTVSLNPTIYSTVLVFLYMADVDSSDAQQTNAEIFTLCWSGLGGVF